MGTAAETVTKHTREDTEVNVEDLLEGGLTISEEHVDSLAWQAGTIQRPCQAVRHLEEVGAQVRDRSVVVWCPGSMHSHYQACDEEGQERSRDGVAPSVPPVGLILLDPPERR